MKTALVNATILEENRFVDGRAVIFEDGVIEAVVPQDAVGAGCRIEDLAGSLLLPGYIDIQVNGGGGQLFNASPTVETIRHIGEVHRQFGTTAFLPTLISDDLDKVEAAIGAVDQAIAEDVPGVLGIHLEGPFLSTDRKGVHDPSKFRRMAAGDVDLLSSMRTGVTVVTLSPENAPPEHIRKLVENGVIVSAGHTDASYAAMRQALDCGTSGFTHLFNAMSPLTSREPGVVGAALEDQESWCGIIVDGRHVAPTTLSIALKTKPLSKFMLVTDAMPTVGMQEKVFHLQGRRITVEDGVCVTESGTLAGSDLDMTRAVKNAVTMLGLRREDAIAMATANPAAFLQQSHRMGRIAPGLQADFIACGPDFAIIEVWLRGVRVLSERIAAS